MNVRPEPGDEIRILVVDDHAVVRSGLTAILNYEPGLRVVGEAPDGETALVEYARLKPDAVLMDLGMPGRDGWSTTAALREIDSQARVIAMSNYSGDEDVHRALRAGAKGYLLKDATRVEIVNAIREVCAGLRHIPTSAARQLALRVDYDELSERETQVLQAVARGCSNKEIGDSLHLSENTIKSHLKMILAKLHVDDRTAAVTLALRRGLIRL